MRRRRWRRLGKDEPWRSFGIASSTSPAAVDHRRGRCPLRCIVARVGAFVAGGADERGRFGLDQTAGAPHSNEARMVSVISPALIAASRSDRSESVRVTGGSPLLLSGTRRRSRRWPTQLVDPLQPPSYTTPRDFPALSPELRELDWDNAGQSTPHDLRRSLALRSVGRGISGRARIAARWRRSIWARPILVSLVRPPLEDGTSSPTRLPFTAARLHRRGRAEGAGRPSGRREAAHHLLDGRRCSLHASVDRPQPLHDRPECAEHIDHDRDRHDPRDE